MLTYNGVTLDSAHPDIASWVESTISIRDFYSLWQRLYWPTANLTDIPFPGILPDGPENGAIRLNRLWWPRGASRWSSIHLLVSESELLAIRGGVATTALGAPYPFVMENNGVSITTDLLALPPLPLQVIPGAAEAGIDHTLHLLTLVDDRWRWWTRAEGSITITPGSTTWAALYAVLAARLGVTLTADAIAAGYLTPPSNFSSDYEYIPLLLDALAYSVGQRIVRRLDGTVLARNFVNSRTDIASNLALGGVLVAGGPVFDADVKAVTPSVADVVFPHFVLGAPTPPPYVSSQPTGGTGPGAKQFHDAAVYDGTNGATLNALAVLMASDYGSQFLGGGTWKYTGILPWLSDGIDDAVEWIHTNLGGPLGEGEVSTRVYPPSWNDLTTASWHFTVSPSELDCPITYDTFDIDQCEEGILNRYRHTITLTFLNHCPQITSTEIFLGQVGCCYCPSSSSSSTSPTSSSSSSCVPRTCVYCSCAPDTWQLVFVAVDIPGCSPLNGTYTLFWDAGNSSHGTCCWGGPWGKNTLDCHGRMTFCISGGYAILTFYRCIETGAEAIYSRKFPGGVGCCGRLTLDLQYSNNDCFPDSLILDPTCCCSSSSTSPTSGSSSSSSSTGIVTGCCPGVTLPETLRVSFSGSISGSVTLLYIGAGCWERTCLQFSGSPCIGFSRVRLCCVSNLFGDNVWQLEILDDSGDCGGVGGTGLICPAVDAISADCSPVFDLVFDLIGNGNACSSGVFITAEVTF